MAAYGRGRVDDRAAPARSCCAGRAPSAGSASWPSASAGTPGSSASSRALIARLIVASPQVSTNTTSSMYGSHATRTSRPVCVCFSVGAGLSPSSRKIVCRFPELQHQHHRADAGKRAQDVGQLRPHVVRHVELHDCERDAADEHGRQHLDRRLPAGHHDDRYIGIVTEIMAHSRPVMALSGSTGRPVTFASVVMGMPIDPKATGAVLAIRQMPAA